MLPEKLTQTTARLYKGDAFIGSGVLFLNGKKLSLLTAAHCIYGDKFDLEFEPSVWHVRDYRGKTHNVKRVSVLDDFLKDNDICLLELEEPTSLWDFTTIQFAPLPDSSTTEFFLRGYYGTKEEPVIKRGISFLEKYCSGHKFLATIDKEQLSNHSFSVGSEWLSGLSGSGLFIARRKLIICAGILVEIPDKGDNGQLLFCGVEALQSIGINIPILPVGVYRYDPENLSDTWFTERVQAGINALGKRYTPDMNF